jgi:hypothetical protein
VTGPDDSTTRDVVECDVCIVGAGIAGLNAAYVASQYLTADQRIVIVDRHDRAGGMWNDTYSYVRLHQPHPVFTAGDIKWTLGREPSYLATKDEVAAHLRHCLDVISRRVRVEPLWGSEYVAHVEVGDKVEVSVRRPGAEATTVRADRLIKATGLDVEVIDALPVSSAQVRSISPQSYEIRGRELRDSAAPVWVVGSGKTAMDTLHVLLTDNPRRQVNLVMGSGTWFLNRDRGFPEGARRWFGGVRPNAILSELARRFDGTNEDEVRRWALEHCGISAVDGPQHHLFGLLSEAEARTVRSGVTETVRGHFADVLDKDGVPHLVLRDGATRRLEPGTWIVNCTGYFRPHQHDDDPYTSPSGRVLAVGRSSVTLGFTSFTGYFMTHLMFLGKLGEVPLYSVDLDEAKAATGSAMAFVSAALLQYNLSVIFEAVPAKVFQDCGIDFDLMYPFPRRLAGQLRFMATHKRDREHHRRTLDIARERFGIRCGPISPEQPVPAPA